jgi:hypothetical protein
MIHDYGATRFTYDATPQLAEFCVSSLHVIDPNNGIRKYHCDLTDNCYKGPEIPSCLTQAMMKNGL